MAIGAAKHRLIGVSTAEQVQLSCKFTVFRSTGNSATLRTELRQMQRRWAAMSAPRMAPLGPNRNHAESPRTQILTPR